MRVSITKPRHLQGTDESYLAGLGFNPYKYVPDEIAVFLVQPVWGKPRWFFSFIQGDYDFNFNFVQLDQSENASWSMYELNYMIFLFNLLTQVNI